MTDFREIAARMIADGEGTVKRGGRHVVYDDATGQPLKQGDTIKGHPTIGHGRNVAGKGISEDEARMMLLEDVRDAEDIARGFLGQVPWQALGDVRRAVLIDMAHNLGADGLYAFTKLRKAIHGLDFDAAASEIASSRYFEQVGGRGVRNREAMRTGVWSGAGSDRLVPRVDVAPVAPPAAHEAPAKPGDSGRVWCLARKRKTMTGHIRMTWMGGFANLRAMVLPNETAIRRLGAALTRAEAEDAMALHPELKGQGFEIEGID